MQKINKYTHKNIYVLIILPMFMGYSVYGDTPSPSSSSWPSWASIFSRVPSLDSSVNEEKIDEEKIRKQMASASIQDKIEAYKKKL